MRLEMCTTGKILGAMFLKAITDTFFQYIVCNQGRDEVRHSTHLRRFTFALIESVIFVTVNRVFQNSSGQGFVPLSREKTKTFCRPIM